MTATDFHNESETGRKRIKRVTTGDGLALLPHGAPVTLDAESEQGLKQRFRATFIGSLPGQHLLLSFPVLGKNDLATLLDPDCWLTVRGVSTSGEGAVLGFRCQVLHQLYRPTRMLVVSVPESVQVCSMRSESRFRIRLAIEIEAEQQQAKGFLEDISCHGCCFTSELLQPVAVETQIKLSVRLPGQSQRAELTGQIRNQRDQQGFRFYGVRLDNRSVSIAELILQWLILGREGLSAQDGKRQSSPPSIESLSVC